MTDAADAEAKPERTGLAREFDYYLAHQDAMVELYNGRVIVLKDCVVIGAYDNYGDAVLETEKQHELGTFLVQRVSPGPGDYTVTIRSRY